MVDITLVYEGELRCRATHGPSQMELITDAPVDNQGKGRSFSPTDLCATAFATCTATILAIAAQNMGKPVTTMAARVEKHMSADAPRRIVALPLTLTISGDYTPEEQARLERTARACPVHHSLHPDIDRPVTFTWA